MQFPKIAFVLCAVAAVSTAVRAADNPDQAAARALLVSKLFEISGESASTNSASQPAKPAVTTPAPAYTAPSAPSFSTTTKVVPAVKAENNAVMHPVHQAVAPAYTPSTPYSSRPPMSSEEHYRALRSPHQEIEDSQMNWTKAGTSAGADGSYAAKPAKKVVTQNPPAVSPQATPSTVKANPEFVPVVAPALPIGASQQQKLLDLLAKYKADQISPEEYHRQRAAIISGM